MAIDHGAVMLDPLYAIDGRDATITLADTGATAVPVRALYQGSGALAGGGNMVGVSTVRVSAAIRVSEWTTAGYTAADLDGAEIEIEFPAGNETWAIKSWVPAPGPSGEADGEWRLILTEPRS